MTLAKTVTKMFPTPNKIGINLVVTDDGRDDLEPLGPGVKVVISKTISRQFITGQDMANEVRDDIGREAQRLIDEYKVLKARFDNATYSTKVSQINGALTL